MDRTFEQYRVVGSAPIVDSQTGADVDPGGIVNLDPNPYTRTLATGEVQEVAGVNIRALLGGGHIAPIEVPATGKDPKK